MQKAITIETLRAIKLFQDGHGYSPTVRELMGLLGLHSTSVASYRIASLVAEGHITKEFNAPRTIVITAKGRNKMRRG